MSSKNSIEGKISGIASKAPKTIVKAHGGIRVVSCVEQGSVFTFSLPAER